LSTDLRGFDFVELKPEGKMPLPVADIRWAITATAGAFHKTHGDSDGLATSIQTVTGCKLWFLFRGKGAHSTSTFAHPDQFNGRFAIDSGDLDQFVNQPSVEMVILRPGSVL
jgi:hypothetical protein